MEFERPLDRQLLIRVEACTGLYNQVSQLPKEEQQQAITNGLQQIVDKRGFTLEQVTKTYNHLARYYAWQDSLPSPDPDRCAYNTPDD